MILFLHLCQCLLFARGIDASGFARPKSQPIRGERNCFLCIAGGWCFGFLSVTRDRTSYRDQEKKLPIQGVTTRDHLSILFCFDSCFLERMIHGDRIASRMQAGCDFREEFTRRLVAPGTTSLDLNKKFSRWLLARWSSMPDRCARSW